MLPFGGGIQQVTMTGPLLQQVLTSGRLNKGKGGFFAYGRLALRRAFSDLAHQQQTDTQ